MATETRTTGPQEAALLDALARRRSATVSLREDHELLKDLSSQPRQLLSRMARKGLLHALGAGRYAVAPRGTDMVEQAAPPEILLDAWMRGHGPYYLGFLSALIAHRLTDLHQREVQIAVPGNYSRAGTTGRVAGLPVRVTRISSPERWFGAERVRVDRLGFYMRSDLSRTMVDTLYRPALCGGWETIGVAWGRWSRREDADPEQVAAYAARLGDSVARRAGYLLTLTGHQETALNVLGAHTHKSGRVLLDAADAYKLPDSQRRWDARWGLTVNLPDELPWRWIEARE